MYAQPWNQLYHMLHFLLAFSLLLVLYPKLLFKKDSLDHLENFMGNVLRTVPIFIVIGYILVVTKLFEFLSITTIMLLLAFYRFIAEKSPEEKMQSSNKWNVRIYDYFEGLYSLRQIGAKWSGEQRKRIFTGGKNVSVTRVITVILFLIIIGISGYIRFYDAFTSPAPGMSDGNVTLKFMKFIDMRILFPDGFYPAGFYIILDTIFKFADINAIYILKYMGPFNILLIQAGLYFVVSRFTKNTYAGMAASIIYGLLGPLFASSAYDRQAATNSQEFAFVFVLPALYFYNVYLRTGKKQALWTALAGTSTVGLVHLVGFTWLGTGMGIMLVLYLLLNERLHNSRALYVALAGVISMLVAVIPYVMSKLFHVEVHSSTGTYLVTRLPEISSPSVNFVEKIALVSGAIVLLQGIFMRGNRLSRLPYLFSSLFVFGTFLIYYYGGPITHLEVVAGRSFDVWVLCIPFIIGMSWHTIFLVLYKLKMKKKIELGLCIAATVVSLIYVPVKPIIPYKMEADAAVEQYMNISREYKQYLIVSPRVQEYALVLGSGNHMYLDKYDPYFLGVYDPQKAPLTKFGEDKYDTKTAPDIFIYYEKNIFKQDTSDTSSEKHNYDDYEKQYPQLKAWIQSYREAHANDNSFSIYYEDDNFIVYHLHRDQDRKDVINKIWS
ncbi:hypothetical protein ACFQZT_23980 [Paenibacillus sp. GCM10027628]|uniref:hypothetical protein n=1 Tax=Paenibacillus sp. GCM10027628 TaxID=3273413 RepID=UPI003640C45D